MITERYRYTVEGFKCTPRTMPEYGEFISGLADTLFDAEERIDDFITYFGGSPLATVADTVIVVVYPSGSIDFRVWSADRFVAMSILSCKKFNHRDIRVALRDFLGVDEDDMNSDFLIGFGRALRRRL